MRRHHGATSAKLVAEASRYQPGRRILLQLLALATALVAACGSPSNGPTSPAGASGFPMTTKGGNGASVTLARRPTHIVSLSPTATEMLFAINAGKQVVAVDDQSNYPASAPITKLSGFQPNIEAITAYKPDLVVAAEDAGGLVHGLEANADRAGGQGPQRGVRADPAAWHRHGQPLLSRRPGRPDSQ